MHCTLGYVFIPSKNGTAQALSIPVWVVKRIQNFNRPIPVLGKRKTQLRPNLDAAYFGRSYAAVVVGNLFFALTGCGGTLGFTRIYIYLMETMETTRDGRITYLVHLELLEVYSGESHRYKLLCTSLKPRPFHGYTSRKSWNAVNSNVKIN